MQLTPLLLDSDLDHWPAETQQGRDIIEVDFTRIDNVHDGCEVDHLRPISIGTQRNPSSMTNIDFISIFNLLARYNIIQRRTSMQCVSHHTSIYHSHNIWYDGPHSAMNIVVPGNN